MFKRSVGTQSAWGSGSYAAFVLGAALLLGGCVTEVRYVPSSEPPPAVADVAADDDAAVQADEAPPPLPDYEQPPCPGPGYLWTPGYWAFAGGYYWVPGTWVMPPRIGVLWTPGYWGFVGGVYMWHAGYWGPHVGFYGGVNYGSGYGGVGFVGGRWVGNSFAYNRAVTNVNVTIVHNTYNETVVRNVYVNRTSFNGGPRGIAASPTREDQFAARERHIPPTFAQHQHIQEAARNPALFSRANGWRPAIAATPRPAAFNAPGVVRARGGEQFRSQPEFRGYNPMNAERVRPQGEQHPAYPAGTARAESPHRGQSRPHPQQRPKKKNEPEHPERR